MCTQNQNPQPNGTSLSLVSYSVNSNNVFVGLKTNPVFTFPNNDTMKNFIKYSFGSGVRPSVYCLQRTSPELNMFDCLLIYPSGIPNRLFDVNFSYNYQGQSAQTVVQINPFLGTQARRRGRSRT